MAAAKIAARIKGQTTCLHHKVRQLELYCEKCQELACVKCVSSIHKGHLLCDISEIADQRKEDIRNFIDKTEQNEMVQNRRDIASIEVLLRDNDSAFEELSAQVKMQTEKLKQELDKLAENTLSYYQKMKDDNTKLIQNYKQDLEMYDKQLKQQMQDCRASLQHGSSFEIYDTECEIDSRLCLPAKPGLGTASFNPNQNFRDHLKLAMGNAIITGQGHTITDQEGSVTTSDDDQQQHSTQQQSKGSREKLVTRNTLLKETKVAMMWKSPCYISSICPTTDDQAWTSNGSKILTLLDRRGTVIQKVTHDVWINDISLSPITHRLWVCDDQGNILELVSGQLLKRFMTKERPISVCVTSTNHVIVCMCNHINKYTTKGQIELTTTFAGTVEPVHQMVTVCHITNNVAVTYSSVFSVDVVDDRVIVMDTNFQELFVYRGEIPSTYKQTPQTGGRLFRPCGIVYDSQGNIIIADRDNDRLLLLTGAVELLKIIHTDSDNAWAIGIDRQDVLWSVFRSNFSNDHVRILQYSSKT